MTADNDSADIPEQGSPTRIAPGAQLRAAREAEGLSVDDVAHQLRLEAAVIRAVEADELDSLGAPVFVKGYLRSYARLLGLPEQELVDAWQPGEPDPEEFRSLSMQTEVKTGTSISIFALWLLFGLLLLASVIYLLSGDDELAAPAVIESVPAAPEIALPSREADFVIEEDVAAAVFDGTDSRDQSSQETGLSYPEITTPAAEVEPEARTMAETSPEPLPAPEVIAGSEKIEVQLTFSDECWVELSDVSRRLLYGLEKAGSVRNFSAQPPLRFFVGNVDAVGIRLAGKEYAIPQRVRTGRNTARFALNADDIERLR